MTPLHAAAQAVIDRWETPLWKNAPATATFIYALRDALAADLAVEATAEPVAQWISVDDERKPKPGTVILVAVAWTRVLETDDSAQFVTEGVDVTEGEWSPEGEHPGCFFSFQGSHGDSYGVTHWMPLPAPPQLPKEPT